MVISYDYEREVNDAYYEPAWCDDKLFEFLEAYLPQDCLVWDPACGTGTIVEAARRAGHKSIGSDVVQRWEDGTKGRFLQDFLGPNAYTSRRQLAIVSNPPFKLAQEFATKALKLAPMVAFLLPSTWIQGAKRTQWLSTTPLRWYLPMVPRPSMPPIGSNAKPQGGKVDYSWFVWDRGYVVSPRIAWLRK